MGVSVRQAARQKALDVQRAKRRERAEAEKRRSALGVDVAVALEERDAAIERHELAAGRALAALVDDEGVSLSDVSEWVPDVEASEVRRLKKLGEVHDVSASEPTSPDRVS